MYLTLSPIRTYPFVLQLCVAFLISPMAAIGWALANWNIVDLFGLSGPSRWPVMFSDVFPTIQLLTWVFLTWCGVYFSVLYRNRLVAREIDLVNARALALDAQNRMLRYQLNPHFLFNTLNALSALVLDDKRDQAERILLALSRFLRYSLEQDPAAKTPLRTEIAAQEEYLAIEQIRFGDKLRYVKAIEPAALDALVPCFILQPAVENSMKYAVAPSTRPVTVEIRAGIKGNQIVLNVRDDGTHEKATGSSSLGVGLENVRNRLALIYGSAATMVSQQLTDGGYEFEVRVPLERG
jgi:LytS/YehU family sensor histidine kinase